MRPGPHHEDVAERQEDRARARSSPAGSGSRPRRPSHDQSAAKTGARRKISPALTDWNQVVGTSKPPMRPVGVLVGEEVEARPRLLEGEPEDGVEQHEDEDRGGRAAVARARVGRRTRRPSATAAIAQRRARRHGDARDRRRASRARASRRGRAAAIAAAATMPPSAIGGGQVRARPRGASPMSPRSAAAKRHVEREPGEHARPPRRRSPSASRRARRACRTRTPTRNAPRLMPM